MAKKLIRESASGVKAEGFGGIDRSTPKTDDSGLYDLENFRVLPDFSVEKRCGYRKFAEFPADVRAVFAGVVQGNDVFLVAAGNKMYSLDPDDGTVLASAAMDTSVGDVDFFYHDGLLYMMDGVNIYRYTPSTVFGNALRTYIPLYAKDWHPVEGGDVYEPVNMLEEMVRLRFCTDGLAVNEIDLHDNYKGMVAAFVDGERDRTVVFDQLNQRISGEGFETAKTVEVIMTLFGSRMKRENITSCKRAVEYGKDGESSILLWGGNDDTKIFCSSYVSPERVEEAKRVNSVAGSLYFPVTDGTSVGNGRFSVRSACNFSKKIYLFTNGGTWSADIDGGTPRNIRMDLVNTCFGCCAEGASTVCENAPYTVDNSGIFKWNERALKNNECDALCISTPIADALPQDFAAEAKVCAVPSRHEIWFRSPGCLDCVWIYNYGTSIWTRFSGIGAGPLFVTRDTVGFASGEAVYLFDEEMYVDDDGDEESEIVAVAESKYFDFLNASETKRIRSMSLEYEGDGDVTLSLCDGGAHSHEYFFGERTDGVRRKIVKRAKHDRMKQMKFTLTAGGESRQRIYSVELCTERKK